MSVTNAACRGGAIVYCFDTPIPFLKTVHLDQLVPVKDGQRIMETSECLVRQPLPEDDQGMIRCLVMSREPLLTKYEVEKKFLDGAPQDEIRWYKKGQQWTQVLELKVATTIQANPLPQNQNPPHTVAAVLPFVTNAPQNNAKVHPNGGINAHHVSHPEPSTSQITKSAITGPVADTEMEPEAPEALRSPTKRNRAAASSKSPKKKHTVAALRGRRKRKRSDAGSEKENSVIMADEEVDETDYNAPSTSRGPLPRSSPTPARKNCKVKPSTAKPRGPKKKKLGDKKSVPAVQNGQRFRKALLEAEKFIPPAEASYPKWLTETVPKPAPYFPQIGDIVYYFQEGHERYVSELLAKGIPPELYKGMPKPNWNFQEVEVFEVVGLKFANVKVVSEGVPVIHHIAEIEMKRKSSHPNSKTYKISFHEMPDIEDFLILEEFVLKSHSEPWAEKSRVKSLFLEGGVLKWYKGTIDSIDRDSSYHMLSVRWDGQEEAEPVGLWDVRLINEEEENSLEDGTVITVYELREMAYKSTASDWNEQDPTSEMNRILNLLYNLTQLQEAEQFTAPVDLEAYPDYFAEVAYPIDLNTIQHRLAQQFYRHKDALIFDFRQVAVGCELYNGDAAIAMNANIIADICVGITNDPSTAQLSSAFVDRIKKKWKTEFETRRRRAADGVGARSGPALDSFVDSSLLSDSEEEKSDDDDNDSEYSVQFGDDGPGDEEFGPERLNTIPEDASEPDSDEEDDGYDYGRESRPQRKKVVPMRLRTGRATSSRVRFRPKPGQIATKNWNRLMN